MSPGERVIRRQSELLSFACKTLATGNSEHLRFLIWVLFCLKKEKGGKYIPLFLYVSPMNQHPGVI
ncbi:MAG: hypothetical protein B6I30_08085 [Desulfobacteraceae bacterium 4572_187]|nr:MAG: hypothetical protein B6I30_08085 [Desulfobacteraceae bacterium 4572_187]